MVELQIDAHIDDVVDLFVEDLGRKAETRNIGTHQSARRVECLEDRHLVAQRSKIVGDRQRRTAATDERHLLAITPLGPFRQPCRDVLAMIGRNSLEPADCNRLLFHAAAAARRFTGAVAHAPEYSREHVRLAILHVGVAKTPLRDEPYIQRYVSVGRTGPLAVDHRVEVVGV